MNKEHIKTFGSSCTEVYGKVLVLVTSFILPFLIYFPANTMLTNYFTFRNNNKKKDY